MTLRSDQHAGRLKRRGIHHRKKNIRWRQMFTILSLRLAEWMNQEYWFRKCACSRKACMWRFRRNLMNKFEHCLCINSPFYNWSMQEDSRMNKHVHYYIRQTLQGSFQVNLMMQLNCHIVSGANGGASELASTTIASFSLKTIFSCGLGVALPLWTNYSMNLWSIFGSSSARLRIKLENVFTDQFVQGDLL